MEGKDVEQVKARNAPATNNQYERIGTLFKEGIDTFLEKYYPNITPKEQIQTLLEYNRFIQGKRYDQTHKQKMQKAITTKILSLGLQKLITTYPEKTIQEHIELAEEIYAIPGSEDLFKKYTTTLRNIQKGIKNFIVYNENIEDTKPGVAIPIKTELEERVASGI